MSEDEQEYILLKWGTLKGWNFNGKSPETVDILNKYLKLGTSMSVACQHDTDEQKKLLCDAIDVFNGIIENDWSGETMTKDEAKEYIMNYGKDDK